MYGTGQTYNPGPGTNAPYPGRRVSIYNTNLGTPMADGPIKTGTGGVLGMQGLVSLPSTAGRQPFNRAEFRNLTPTAYVTLDAERVCQLLSDDGLSVTSEVEAFVAAWTWLSADSWNRKPYLKAVMACVRFPLFSARELYMAARELKPFPETWEFIFNANWYHSCLENNSLENLFFDVPKPRLYYGIVRKDPFSINQTQQGYVPLLENWRDFEIKRGNMQPQIQAAPQAPLSFAKSTTFLTSGTKSTDSLASWLQALKESTNKLKIEVESLNATTRRSMVGRCGRRTSMVGKEAAAAALVEAKARTPDRIPISATSSDDVKVKALTKKESSATPKKEKGKKASKDVKKASKKDSSVSKSKGKK